VGSPIKIGNIIKSFDLSILFLFLFLTFFLLALRLILLTRLLISQSASEYSWIDLIGLR